MVLLLLLPPPAAAAAAVAGAMSLMSLMSRTPGLTPGKNLIGVSHLWV